jgi:methionyl-tRNA synthetase
VPQTKDGMKMGKSLGNILEPRKLLAAYGSDAVRFYFLKEVVFGQARLCLPLSVEIDSLL